MAIIKYTAAVNKIRRSWNMISGHYVRSYPISDSIIHFGPLCPGEDKLKILGNIRGKRVLELGCGAGQNSVALSRAGAIVTAVDFAEAQLEKGRLLAFKNDMNIEFIAGDISDLSQFKKNGFDIAFSACSISFIKNIEKTFSEIHRVVKPDGRLILSDMHPLQYILDEIEGGVTFNHRFPYKPITMRWSWDFEARNGHKSLSAGFKHYVRSLSYFHNALVDAGFAVSRILEPKSTRQTPHRGFSREIWREYKYIAEHLPITYIMVCERQ